MANAHAISSALNASGIHVASAYPRLGPITSFTDVLLGQPGPTDSSARLAAEQVVHLTDGWRYAASAIAAFLKNSPSEVIHLAYYAELRAAFSLYSGSGIRLESNDNYYVDSSGIKQQLPTSRSDRNLRTHTIAWDLWTEWVKRHDAQNLLLDGLRIAPSISLRSMTPVLTLFSPALTIGQWGYDLITQPSADRAERNRASYLPRYAVTPLKKMTTGDLNFILGLCRLLLPSKSGLTNSLAFDEALIRYRSMLSIESKVHENEANRPQKIQIARDEFVQELSTHTGQDAGFIDSIFDVPNGMESQFFEFAAESLTEPKNVLCRAIFLLRLAMLSVEKNLHSNSPTPGMEWLLNWMESAGIREKASVIDPFDLYADLENAIDQHSSSHFSELPAELWSAENAASTYMLTRVDRSLAWGVVR